MTKLLKSSPKVDRELIQKKRMPLRGTVEFSCLLEGTKVKLNSLFTKELLFMKIKTSKSFPLWSQNFRVWKNPTLGMKMSPRWFTLQKNCNQISNHTNLQISTVDSLMSFPSTFFNLTVKNFSQSQTKKILKLKRKWFQKFKFNHKFVRKDKFFEIE